MSVRLALGASRWRLARQLLMESIVLAGIGASLGLVLAIWASRALVTQLSSAAPVVLDLSLDGRVLAFTAATMIATVILFGLAPALRATRVAPMDALKAHGRGPTGDARAYVSNGLLVAQVALSLLLVVAAGLFVRTFAQLTRVSLGFDRDRVLWMMVTAPTVPAADRNPFYHRLVRAAAAVPGVAGAGGSLNPPLTRSSAADVVATLPGTEPRADAGAFSQFIDITPGWLAAYGTPIRAGRDLDDHDTQAARPVMLVNETFVRRLFPGRTLIGTTVALTAHDPPYGDRSLVLTRVNMATYSAWSFPPARVILTSQEDEGNAASQPVSNRPVAARASRLGESGAPVYVAIFSSGASAHDPVGGGGARQ
jgi:hypothetical protein